MNNKFRRPWKEMAPKKPVIKRRKLAIESRPQLLSVDSLVDVFSWSKRSHLDQWHIISHKFNNAALNAKPLRSVDDIKLAYDADQNVYKITFTRSQLKFKSNAKKKTWHVTGLQRDVVGYTEAIDIFFGALRHTSFSESICFKGIEISADVVNRLKDVAKDFRRLRPRHPRGTEYVKFDDVTLTNDADPFELIAAFPGLDSVPHDAGRLLRDRVGINDRLLVGLAAHGLWDSQEIWYDWNAPLPNGITEQGILGYLFGGSEANNDEQRRIIKLHGVSLSPQFLHKLVQARRDCNSAHKAYLSVDSKQMMDIVNMAEHGRMWTSVPIPIDYWEFTFPDVPKFFIRYRVPKPHYVDYRGVQQDFLGGFGQIECWSNYDKKSDVWRD